MNPKEKQLEEISEKISNYAPVKHSPLFEMFVTMISIAMAIMLFLFPDMLSHGFNGVVSLYGLILGIMPQWAWAFAFCGAGLIKAVGLLIDSKVLRIAGLIASAIIYAIFTIMFATHFPNVGTIMFVATTVFSLISIPEVKRSGIND